MKWHLKHARHGKKPWDVQAEAIRQREASGRDKYGFWLEQGLGKTSLTLNEFYTSDADIAVVLCPNSFRGDWATATEEWGIPQIPSRLFNYKWSPSNHDKQIVVLNHEAARRGFKSYDIIERLLEKRRAMLVIDEASCIKNPESETSKSFIELAKRAKYVRELNGTPLTLNVMDYYPQLRCLGELNGIKSIIFRARYAVMGGYMGRQIVDVKNEEELYSIIGRCAFRALKSDWRKDLPPQTDIPVHIEMTDKQRVHYYEMLEEFLTVVDGMEMSADMVLTQYDKLRQLSSCVAMQNGNMRLIEEPKNIPKIKAALDLHHTGMGKTIFVYTYKPSGEVLFKATTDAKLKPAWLKGGMKPSEITEEKRRFHDDPSCRGLVLQQAAHCMAHTLLGGEGVNDRCARQVFYENSFSLRDRLQMRDRNHRGEQDQPCNYYDLVTSPMDEIVIAALEAKKAVADTIDSAVKVAKKEAKRKY